MAKTPSSFRPMLAGECKAMTDLELPGYVSPKLDGIRCIIHPRLGPVTRNLKPIPNRYIRGLLKPEWMPAFDGELIVGDPTNPASWNETQSGVMSEEGKPPFTFFVFDLVDCAPVTGFRKRYAELTRIITKDFRREAPFVRLLAHTQVNTHKTLRAYEDDHVRAGYEGIMFRAPSGPYKWGRSTPTEGYLMKIKRFRDAEAIIVGFEEKKHNANAAKKNALGLTERSSHKANQIAMNTLGALVVRATYSALGIETPPPGSAERDTLSGLWQGEPTIEFKIGTGFDDRTRKHIWQVRDQCTGWPVKFRFQKLSPDGKPIFPSYVGFVGKELPKMRVEVK